MAPPSKYNADGGTNLNFSISRANLPAGDYTIAVQRYTTHNAAYGLETVAVVPGAPTPPSAPGAPLVSAASSTAVVASWVAPGDGGTAITGYNIRYREGRTGSFTPWAFSGTGTRTKITGLKADTGYQVQVRARNSIGRSPWGLAGEASTEGPDAVVTLEIDWGNDGTYSHAAADVTGDLVKHTLRTTRGRTLQSRRKAVAGRLEAKLWNLDAKYDPINSNSPIFGRDIAGLRVRAKLADVVIWAGRIDSQRYRHRPVPQLDIIALGLISTLRQPVSVASQASGSVGAAAKLVGAAAGVTTTYLAGGKTLDRWPGVADQDALAALHDLEEYEQGFLHERGDGELALEAETAREAGGSAVSALTLTDVVTAATDIPILQGSALDWGFRQIANVVRVSVIPLASAANVIVLWSTSAIRINAGVALEFHVSYPEDNTSDKSHVGVVSWIEPVAGTDYTAQPGLSVSGRVDGSQYVVTLRNTNQPGQRPGEGTHIVVGLFTLRGTPLVEADSYRVESKDSASIAAFGEREYARPSPLFTDIGLATAYADGRVSQGKVPRGWLVVRWPAESAVGRARSLDLSRRVTVVRLGETADYYVEGIGLTLRGYVRMEYLLSPVTGVTVPSAPVVQVEADSRAGRLAVTWSAPYSGGSVVTDYDVRYRGGASGPWAPWPHTGVARTTTITGLATGTASFPGAGAGQECSGDGRVVGQRYGGDPGQPSECTRRACGDGWDSATGSLLGCPSRRRGADHRVRRALPGDGIGRRVVGLGAHRDRPHRHHYGPVLGDQLRRAGAGTDRIGASGWSRSGSATTTAHISRSKHAQATRRRVHVGAPRLPLDVRSKWHSMRIPTSSPVLGQ